MAKTSAYLVDHVLPPLPRRMESRAVELVVTVRGLDRFRFQPWGAMGGTCGRNGATALNPDNPTERRELGRIRVLTMKQGDMLRMNSPSGGAGSATRSNASPTPCCATCSTNCSRPI